MHIPIVSSFVFYLVGTLAIGIYFYLRTKNLSDYVLGGGYMAVCWTDFFQGILMFSALCAVPMVVIVKVGGWSTAVSKIAFLNAEQVDIFSGISFIWRRMTRNGALVGMVLGAVTVLVWKQLEGGIFDMYKILPGFILCTLAIVIVSIFDKEPGSKMVQEYEKV